MTTLVLSILNGSSSFLHTKRTTIKAWMSLNFDKITLPTLELAALECQYNTIQYNYFIVSSHFI